mgnify:CR=1 FL=1
MEDIDKILEEDTISDEDSEPAPEPEKKNKKNN